MFARSERDLLQSTVTHLRKCIAIQNGGYKLLLQKATSLDVRSAKTRSPDLKSAIEDLLSVVAGLKDSRESVIKAFKTLTLRVPKGEQAPIVVYKEASAQTERNTKYLESQTSDNADGLG